MKPKPKVKPKVAKRRKSLSDSSFPEISNIAKPGASYHARSEILDAAAETLIERGFAGTSINDVADTLGATKGLIYHYYRSKSDIVIDLHLEAIRILIDRVSTIAEDNSLSPAERLYRICFEHAAVLMTNISYQKATALGINWLFVNVSAGYQLEAADLIKNLRRKYEEIFVRAIDQGIKAGVLIDEDPHMLVKWLLGTLNWTALWFRTPAEDPVGQIAATAEGLAAYCLRAVWLSNRSR